MEHSAGLKVTTMLKSPVYKVTALGITASAINSKQVNGIYSFSDYNEPLIQFLGSLPQDERVVLVGHSNLCCSFCTSLYSLEMAKDVCSLLDTQYIVDDGPGKTHTADFMDLNSWQLTLTICPHLRPMRTFSDVELLLKETAVTKERNGRVAKVYLFCEKDNILKEHVAKLLRERSGPADVKLITDSDQMVMFSKPVQRFLTFWKLLTITSC